MKSRFIRKMEIKSKIFFKKAGKYSRGAVSLFLAIVISPLMGLSFMLLETIRYQEVIETMLEVEDVSALAVLANYDEFVESRFGVLAMSQEEDSKLLFNYYLSKNISSVKNDVTVNSTAATGDNSLGDLDILQQQVMEFSELIVPVTAAGRALDATEIFDKLKQYLKAENLDWINNTAEVADGAASLADSCANFAEHLTGAIDYYNKADTGYAARKSQFDTAWGNFHTEATAYVEVLSSESANHQNDGGLYDDSDVTSQWSNLNNARNSYKTAVDNMHTAVQELNGKLDELSDDLDDISEAMEGLTDGLGDLTGSSDEARTTSEWVYRVASEIINTMGPYVGDVANRSAATTMSNLNALSTRLNTTNFTNTTLTASTTDSTITSTYTTDAGIYDNFGTDAGSLKSLLESSAASQDDADMGQGLFDLLDTLYGLFAIPTFYDGNLNSIVIYGDMYNSDAHVSPEYTIIQSMFGTIAAAKDFVLSLATLDIIGALIAVADFIRCLADFIIGMIDYQLTSIRMIVSLFDDANGRSFGERLYNQYLISGYSAYNFPNRTNYGKFKPLAGGSGYKEIRRDYFGFSSNPTQNLMGTFESISSLLTDPYTATSTCTMFKGAEGEYMLCGGQSETINQISAFFDIYMFRMLVDGIMMAFNSEVEEMASAANMFCWVVYLLVLAFEPLIDCIFLANGQKEHLIKTQLYLTPSGIVPLVSHAINLVPAVKNMFKAADIKDEFNSSLGEAAGGTPGDDGSFGTDLNGYVNMDYTDHLMILILFRVEQQTQLKRIQNIIQMEGKTYYQELKNKDFEFRLENAGTHLNTTVNYSLNPLFNVDGLTAEGGAYSVVSTVKNTY